MRLSRRITAGLHALSGQRVLVTEYPVLLKPRQQNTTLRERFEAETEQYRALLVELEPSLARLRSLGTHPDDPFWPNEYFSALDGAILYSLIATRTPSTYLEIGSGFSTLFAARAKRDHSGDTRIISIDPQPRRDVDRVCDEVLRSRLETLDRMDVFTKLQAGDICFVDNSHRALPNSDVTVFFLEVLPKLAPGVIVGLHDIVLPDDYTEDGCRRFYSEQYLLATALLMGDRLRPLLPLSFLCRYTELMDELRARRQVLPATTARQWLGSAFWCEVIK